MGIIRFIIVKSGVASLRVVRADKVHRFLQRKPHINVSPGGDFVVNRFHVIIFRGRRSVQSDDRRREIFRSAVSGRKITEPLYCLLPVSKSAVKLQAQICLAVRFFHRSETHCLQKTPRFRFRLHVVAKLHIIQEIVL